MADAYAKFTYINVGCNGRISDGGVLNRSDLMNIIKQPSKYFPSPKCIGNNRLLPYVIVADNAFPLSNNMMTPYTCPTTDKKKIVFNRRLSRARQNVERAFGILSNKFQVLQKTIKLKENKTCTIVQCCCILHNFLIINSHWYNESCNENLSINNNNLNINPGEDQNITRLTANQRIRNEFTEYFYNEGKI